MITMQTARAPRKKPRLWRWLTFFLFALPLVLLLLFALTVALYAKFYLKEFIADRLTRTVIAASDSLYALQTSSFAFNVESDTIEAKDVALVPIRREKNPNATYHEDCCKSV